MNGFWFLITKKFFWCGACIVFNEEPFTYGEFILQSRYYIHFQANTHGKGMNPLILPAMG